MSAASIAFLLDEHVAHAVAQALRRRGIDAQTATEARLLGATDSELLAYAQQAGRVVVTHDDDFLRLHHRQPHAGIAFCTQGARTIGQPVASLTLIFEVLEPADMINQVEFL